MVPFRAQSHHISQFLGIVLVDLQKFRVRNALEMQAIKPQSGIVVCGFLGAEASTCALRSVLDYTDSSYLVLDIAAA